MTNLDPHSTEIVWVPLALSDSGPNASTLISVTPVTVAQFQAFLDAGGYRYQSYWSLEGWRWKESLGIVSPSYWGQPGYDLPAQPVTGVSLHEAEAFARFIGAAIPNEDEWYQAASNAGSSRYPWGSDAEGIAERRANLSFFGVYRPAGLTEVDRFPAGANHLGVRDLLGNVGEWTYPRTSTSLQPCQRFAVLRGGCSWHDPNVVDVHFRDEVVLEVRDNQTGIRLVRRQTVGMQPAPLGEQDSAPPPPSGNRRPIVRPSRPFRQEGIPTHLDERTWRLHVHGVVRQPLALSLPDIKSRYAPVRRTGLYVCVCRWGQANEVVGASLLDVLLDAMPSTPLEESYILQRSVPGPDGKVYETTIPAADAVAHDALLCYEMDGWPLSLEYGWPLRLIDFRLYGYKQVKCLGELVLTREFARGWWEEQKRYDPSGIIQPGTITIVGNKPSVRRISRPGEQPIE